MADERELEGVETAIQPDERRVAELEMVLNDPGFYVTSAKEAPGLIAAKAEVARLYAW